MPARVFAEPPLGLVDVTQVTGPMKGATEARTRVRALMVQNEFDPSTPYAGALMDRRVNGHGTRMVLVNNATTHGVMFDDNTCTTNVEFAYLNLGVMPSRDVVCQAPPMHSFAMQDTVTYEYGHPARAGGCLRRRTCMR